MLLRDYMEERGLSPEDVAAVLAEQGITFRRGSRKGEPVDAGYIANRGTTTVPKVWRGALGLDPSGPPPSSAGPEPQEPHADPSPRERREAPPRRPREAKVTLPEIEPGAKKRIAGAYRFVGAAAAAGAGSEGVAVVFDDQADPIADLWIQAAAENPWAARFVEMMGAAGVAGDLAAAHLYLVGGVFYVLGAGIPAGDQLFAKYRRYRVVTPPKGDTAQNGAARAEESQPAAAGPVEHDQG